MVMRRYICDARAVGCNRRCMAIYDCAHYNIFLHTTIVRLLIIFPYGNDLCARYVHYKL